MKESKVKYEDIKSIYDTLVAQGKKPTTATIRQMLGFGSFSTITDHLRKLKKTLPVIELTTDDITDEITLALNKVLERKVANNLRELQLKIIELSDERDAVLAESLQAEILIEELEYQNKELAARLAIANAKINIR